MNLYLIVRSTHVTAMLLTLVLTMATEPLVLMAARAHSIEQLERLYRLSRRFQQLSQLTTMIGLLAGITMVVMARWNPLAPWLVATYGLLALMSVVGRAGNDWRRRLDGALRIDGALGLDGGAVLADVRSVLVDRHALLSRLAVIAIFFAIMMLMQQKPSFDLF